jgi:enoyl-CoA hydratase/carnithine racemase
MSEAISAMQAARRPLKDYPARHFRFEASDDGRVATVRLNRPERKNPLTFDSYAELRDLFRDLTNASDVRAIVLAGAGGKLLLGRRCLRDHRTADQNENAGSHCVYANDRRCRQGDAQMPPADHRRGRRDLRRRRRNSRNGFRSEARDAGGQDGVSVHARWPGRR